MIIWVMKIFFYSSSVYCCHFLIFSAFIRSISFVSFIVPIFAWNVSLVSLVFLERALVFPILLFSSIFCTDHRERLSYVSLLFFGTLHSKWLYLSFSPLSFLSLLFSAICKASPDSHFGFLHFFSMRMVLIPVSYTMSWTSVHRSSGTLSDLVP